MMKTILVTGANGNLGRVVVKTLHRRGHQLIAALGPGKVPTELTTAVKAHELVDLMDESETYSYIHRIISSYPRLNTAILLAGGFAMGKIGSTNAEDLDKQFSLNFKTSFFVVRPLIEHFQKIGGGEFVMIGARPAIQEFSGQDMVAYALSKSLVIQLAKIINAGTNDHQVKASVIVPSIIDTPTNRQAMPDADFSKWVSPEAIARTIEFILSDAGKNLREPVFKMYHQS